MNKKFLIVMITFLLTMSNVVFANGTKINDIEKSSSYASYSIKYLAELKVISGDENGNFNPQNQ